VIGATSAGYNAQLGQFNANQAGSNNMMSGLFSLGGAALGGPLGAKAGGFLGGLMEK